MTKLTPRGLARDPGRTSSPDRQYSTHTHGTVHNHSGAAEGEARVLEAATGAASLAVVREVEVDFRFRRVRL